METDLIGVCTEIANHQIGGLAILDIPKSNIKPNDFRALSFEVTKAIRELQTRLQISQKKERALQDQMDALKRSTPNEIVTPVSGREIQISQTAQKQIAIVKDDKERFAMEIKKHLKEVFEVQILDKKLWEYSGALDDDSVISIFQKLKKSLINSISHLNRFLENKKLEVNILQKKYDLVYTQKNRIFEKLNSFSQIRLTDTPLMPYFVNADVTDFDFIDKCVGEIKDFLKNLKSTDLILTEKERQIADSFFEQREKDLQFDYIQEGRWSQRKDRATKREKEKNDFVQKLLEEEKTTPEKKKEQIDYVEEQFRRREAYKATRLVKKKKERLKKIQTREEDVFYLKAQKEKIHLLFKRNKIENEELLKNLFLLIKLADQEAGHLKFIKRKLKKRIRELEQMKIKVEEKEEIIVDQENKIKELKESREEYKKLQEELEQLYKKAKYHKIQFQLPIGEITDLQTLDKLIDVQTTVLQEHQNMKTILSQLDEENKSLKSRIAEKEKTSNILKAKAAEQILIDISKQINVFEVSSILETDLLLSSIKHSVTKETFEVLKENLEERKKQLVQNEKKFTDQIHDLTERLNQTKRHYSNDFTNFIDKFKHHTCEKCTKITERKHFLRLPVNLSFNVIEKSIFKENVIQEVLVDEENSCQFMSGLFLVYSTFLAERIGGRANIWYRHFLIRKFYSINFHSNQVKDPHEHFYCTFVNPVNSPDIISKQEFFKLTTAGQRLSFFPAFATFDQINKTQISLYKDSKICRKLFGESKINAVTLESSILNACEIRVFDVENDISDSNFD